MEKQYLLDNLKITLVGAGVKSDAILVLAISGGADSMTLLDMMRCIQDEFSWRLVVVHVNHGLRKNAVYDQAVVEKYCAQYQLRCVVKLAKLGQLKSGIEEKARESRYKLLKAVAKKEEASWILTAHNADDQVETIVFNFLRGGFVRGLGGMRLVTGEIIRPLLTVPKHELLQYVKSRHITFAVDETNASLDFTRNRIRSQLLPILREYNHNFDGVVLQNAQLFRQADELLQSLAGQAYGLICEEKNGKVSISISRLRELLPLLQMEVVRMALARVLGNLQGIKKIHTDQIFGLIAKSSLKLTKRLPSKLLVEKAYDKITISRVEA